MQPTSILAMLLAGAALTVAAPGAPTYGSGNAQCPSGYTGADCTEKSPVSVGGNGGSGYYPGGNGGSDSGGNGGSGSGGSGSEQPFTCSQSNGLLQGSAQCCQTNILGVASLTCDPSTSFPTFCQLTLRQLTLFLSQSRAPPSLSGSSASPAPRTAALPAAVFSQL